MEYLKTIPGTRVELTLTEGLVCTDPDGTAYTLLPKGYYDKEE